MKKTEDYIIEKETDHWADQDYSKSDIIKWIKQAQIDAIEEAVKRCAENATVKSEYKSNIKGAKYKEWKSEDSIDSFNTTQRYSIDKKSILQVAEQLKKELE